jgi:SAM-dependent methyltransferase
MKNPLRRFFPAPSTTGCTFTCNICGHRNVDAPLAAVRSREAPSCSRCSSSLRMRSNIAVLSKGLFGRSMTLPDFRRDKAIRGLGMSDWEGYAQPLAEKFDYTNTFYDREPRLDITEHIPLARLAHAFENTRRLLSPGGVFVFSVPWFNIPGTVEHFPDLHDFRLENDGEGVVLLNETKDGRKETFRDLVFHGGDGMTLEMRTFSRQGVLDDLRRAGFSSVEVHGEDDPRFGIQWEIQWAYPILARA